MKKTIKILLLIFVAGFTFNTFAMQRGDKFVIKKESGRNYKDLQYSCHPDGNDSKKYTSFCLDPNLKYSGNWSGVNRQVERVLAQSSNNHLQNSKDYGLLTILGGGKNYTLTLLVTRMYTILTGQVYDPKSGYKGGNHIPEYEKYLNGIVCDNSALEDKIKTNTNIFSYGINCENKSKLDSMWSKEDATSLFTKAIDATINYFNKNIKVPKVVVSDFGGTGSVESPANHYEKMSVVSITPTDFGKTYNTDYLKYQGITTVDGKTSVNLIGYSFVASTEEKDYTSQLTTDTNIIQLLNDNNKKTIYLAFKVVADNTCTGDFIVNYKYNDGQLLTGAQLIAYNKDGRDTTQYQRFVFYSNDDFEKKFVVSNKLCNTVCNPNVSLPQICSESDKDKVNSNGNVTYQYREGIDKTGKLNIEKCILENTDIANNSYKYLGVGSNSGLENNDYCAVYCKEDYDLTVPYRREVESGRYFRLGVTIKGTKTCYAATNDQKFNEDMAELANEISVLSAQYNYYSGLDASYNTIKNNIKSDLNAKVDTQKAMIKDYNACLGLDYNSDDFYSLDAAEIKYNYGEPIGYSNKWVNDSVNKMERISSTKSNLAISYCSDINYNNCATNSSKTNKTYFSCNENGQCFNTSFEFGSNPYVKIEQTITASYDTPRVFYSVHTDGQIKVNPTDTKNMDLVDGLPVGINTPRGTYFYKLTIDGIGQYYTNGEYGRIFSANDNSVVNALQDRTETNAQNTDDSNVSIKSNEYACTYIVSGPNNPGPSSDTYCVKENGSYYVCSGSTYSSSTCTKYSSREEAISKAKVNYSCCPNCTVVCVGRCIYDSMAKLLLRFRTITPSIVNPNGRYLGFNWNSENPNSSVGEKAENTIAEIEKNNSVEVNEGVKVEKVNEYSLKVKLTPDMISEIKAYNDAQEENGGYNDNSLTCYDYTLLITDKSICTKSGYTWKKGTCVMSNIFCYSNYIDKLIEEHGDKIDAPNRAEAKNSAYKNYEVYKGLDLLPKQGNNTTNPYKILSNNYWTIYQYSTLDTNKDGIQDIGPSWK